MLIRMIRLNGQRRLLSLLLVLTNAMIGVWLLSTPQGLLSSAWAAPISADPSIVIVVSGSGAGIWNAESGALIEQLAPGARLSATMRSTDGQWLWVESDAENRGWVAVHEMIVFNIQRLPTENVTITPRIPTATPSSAVTETRSVTLSAGEVVTTTQTSEANAQAAPSGRVTAQVALQQGSLNVRAGPGVIFAVIGKAQPQETVLLIGRNPAGNWVQIEVAEVAVGFGWVAAQYLSTDQDVMQLPVSEKNTQPAPASASTDGVTASAPAPQPPPTGLTGKLVFQISFGGAIYLYDLISGALRPLTHGFDPALSPDGQQVAFTRLGGEHGLWLINVDGSNERRIFSERNAFFSPKWSPDGQRLLFMRTDSGYDCQLCVREELRAALPWRSVRPRLARVDVNGGNYLDLATLDTATAPDWNSAGIIYASAVGIQYTREDSQEANHLVHYDIRQQYYRDPDWQPNGGRILFQQRRAGHWDIFSINLDGSGLAAVTRPATVLVDELPSNVAPAWSPDGQHIVFLSNRTDNHSAGAWRLWVMDADGSHPRPLPIDLPFVYTYVEEQMVDWGR
jgi:Tol biopolymer transport system component/uncharacterized protein YraI